MKKSKINLSTPNSASTLSKRQIKSIKKDLPVVARAGDSNEYYRTADGDFMEILKIEGVSGIRRFSREAYEVLIAEYTAGIRTFTHAFNFAILDFLVDHQKQIDFYHYKMNQLDLSNPVDRVKHYWLMQEVQKLEYRQLHETEEQYFLSLFAESLEQLESQINIAFEVPHLNVKKLSQKAKDAFIYKINNLNSSPYNLLRGEKHG